MTQPPVGDDVLGHFAQGSVSVNNSGPFLQSGNNRHVMDLVRSAHYEDVASLEMRDSDRRRPRDLELKDCVSFPFHLVEHREATVVQKIIALNFSPVFVAEPELLADA